MLKVPLPRKNTRSRRRRQKLNPEVFSPLGRNHQTTLALEIKPDHPLRGPNTDVLIHAAVKDGNKKDTKKQCSRLCSSLCPLVLSTCPLKRKPKRVSTEDKENKKAPHLSPSQVPMNNNPEGASSVSSDNMKPDKNNLGGDGPAREGSWTTWTLTRMPCLSTIYLIFNIYYTPTFLLYSSIRSINKNHDYYTE